MTPRIPIYTARNRTEFYNLSEKYGGLHALAHMEESDLSLSASKWTFRHLLGFRLLTLPAKPVLETFANDHQNHCPVCRPGTSPQKVDSYWKDTLTSDCPLDFLKSSDSELLRLPGGFFWAALARVARSKSASVPRSQPSRNRQPPRNDGFVNSSFAIIGSSSPVISSASEFEMDLDDVDEDEHDARRSKPEEITVQFSMAFIQFALNLCLLQKSLKQRGMVEIQARIDRRTSTTSISGLTSDVRGEDDGGICKMSFQGDGWSMLEPYLALLEAKRAFQYIKFDERTGNHTPLMSNAALAQYLGEVVIAWKERRRNLGQR
ncbi:hypothetical protein N7528_003988 [Penicillium herquei]|nr:hypothetical protein N7528_003988 [Penicillium herquei]